MGQVPYGMLTFGTYEMYKAALLQRFPVSYFAFPTRSFPQGRGKLPSTPFQTSPGHVIYTSCGVAPLLHWCEALQTGSVTCLAVVPTELLARHLLS